MAKCNHCQQRKGKRACPYLHGHICSICCGENRGVNFDCPRECPYFGPPLRREAASEASPQAERARQGTTPSAAAAAPSGAFAPAEPPAPDLSRYQKYLAANRHPLADLMARIELALARYDQERRGLTDADAVSALEFMRRRASPITIMERFTPEMGVFLEQTVLKSYQGRPAPAPFDLMDVLDHLIETARKFGPSGSRRYLDEVALFEKHSRKAGGEGPQREPSSIIVPP